MIASWTWQRVMTKSGKGGGDCTVTRQSGLDDFPWFEDGTHDRVQQGCWVRFSLVPHGPALRERGKPPHVAGTLCPELYNMLKSVGDTRGPWPQPTPAPRGSGSMWRCEHDIRLGEIPRNPAYRPLVLPWEYAGKRADFLPWWRPQRDEGLLRHWWASSLQGRLNSYDRE